MAKLNNKIWTDVPQAPSTRPDRYLYSTNYQFVEDEDNILDVIASSGRVNRLDEIVDVRFGRYENYRKNPVVVWSHDWDSLPIARTIDMQITDDLRHRIEFSPTQEAQQIKELYKLGFLNAWSIGFIIFDYQREEVEGKRIRRITDWEELELSGVVIPADADALTATLSLSGDIELPIELRGAIPYKKTPLADEGEAWDAGREVAEADIDDLKIMCAWYDAEYPNVKNSYKLPHHKASEEHACVWRAVAACGAVLMGARGGVDIPDADVLAVKSHIEKHYHDFDKVAPWEEEAKGLEHWQTSANRIHHLVSEIRKAHTINDTELAMLEEVANRSVELMSNLDQEDIVQTIKFLTNALRYEKNDNLWLDFVREFGESIGVVSIHDPRFQKVVKNIENLKGRLAKRAR